MRLDGKSALVTGAGRGIGRAIALRLAAEGASVAATDIDATMAAETVRLIEGNEGRAVPLRLDVRDSADVERVFAQVIEGFGTLDILVNNAGFARDAMLHKMSEEQFDDVIDVHLKGTWLCTRAAARHMRARQAGRVINLGSISGKVGNVGQTNYSAAKAGVIGLTKAAAKELARYNVTVNAVQPAMVDTEMARAIPAEVLEQKIAAVPLGRIASVEEVAGVVAFLASDDASYLTGVVIDIAGGREM